MVQQVSNFMYAADVQKPKLSGAQHLRGVGSIRLSHLTDETTSPERQRQVISDEAQGLEVSLEGWAEDLNISAAEVEPFSRPALGPWLVDKADDWDVMFFAKQDRAARSMQDMSKLLGWAEKHKKILVVCENPGAAIYDYRDSAEVDGYTKMWAQMGAMFFSFAAELEVYNIKQRVRSMRKYLREHGEWGGGRPPFGYIPERIEGQIRGWRLVEHPESADIVRDIVNRIIDNRDPLLKIAEDLNQAGVPTPFDYWTILSNPKKKTATHRWSVTSLGKMMRSRTLLGEGLYEGRTIQDKDGAPVPRATKGLISSETWNQLQVAMKELSITKTRYSQESETLGVAFCGNCGGPLYAKESTAKGRTYEHLVCRFRQKQYGATCDHPAIPKRAVEAVLRETFMAIASDIPLMRRRYELGDDKSEELATVERLRKSLQKERDLGLIENDEEYFERLQSLVQREKHLRSVPTKKAGYVWEQMGTTYGEEWEQFSPSQRRDILTNLNIKVYVGNPERFSAGNRAWDEFCGSPENSQLPGDQWFSGVRLTIEEVERIVGLNSGERVTDGLSSGQRKEPTERRTYKVKPFQMILVRRGYETIPDQLSRSNAQS